MADAITVPQIVLRATKGSALTPAELDANLEILRNAIVAAYGLLSASLKTDGTLKDDAVAQSAVKDRSIGQAEMKPDAAFWKQDTGSANQYQIAFTPAIAALTDGMFFLVKAANANTGPSTLRVDTSANVKLLKKGSAELDPGDIPAGSVFGAMHVAGVFHLIGGIASGTSGGGVGGFTGITKFDPSDLALPGANTSATFNHTFGTYPSRVAVYLICIADDATPGYVLNDVVPIEDFYISGGEPAFTVTVTTGSIVVTQHSATIKLTKKSDGSQQTITTANWRLGVKATLETAVTTNTFPDLNLQVANPDGAAGYGQFVFCFHHGRHDSKTHHSRWNLQTGAITRDGAFSGSERFNLNLAGFRLSDGTDKIFMNMQTASDGDIQMFDGQTGNRSLIKSGANSFSVPGDTSVHKYKVIWVDEAPGSGGVTNPSLYFALSGYDAAELHTAVRAKKFIYAGANVYNAWANHRIVMNLGHANIVNVAAFTDYHTNPAAILLFQYNPHNSKRRIYVITTATGFLHIFNLLENTTSHATKTNALNANISSWWPTTAGVGGAGFESTQMPMLTYEKAIALSGLGIGWNTPDRDRICVEYDFSTGHELAIVCSRSGTPNQTGTIVRVPWKE